MEPKVEAPGYYQPQPTYPQLQQQQQLPPPPTQQTTVVIQQPQATAIAQNSREWTHGLCSCCEDLGECCYAYWCPFCYWCSLSSRMGEYYCGPHVFPCGCYELFRVAMRTKLRAMHGIRFRLSVCDVCDCATLKGSICDDAICVVCCPCCTSIQMGLELKYHRLS